MKAQSIRIIGVGGCGLRMVERVASDMEDAPSVVAVDTDADALDLTSAAIKIQIGKEATGGFGTGGNSAMARKAAEDENHLIRNLMSGAELVIVAAGLGGGTGSGMLPAILQAARQDGIATLAFVTLPFGFEGQDRKMEADRAFMAVRGLVDGLVVTPNDRLFDATGQVDVRAAFDRGADILCSGIHAAWKMLTQRGCLSLGIAELRGLLKSCGGVCAFGFGEGAGEDRAGRAAELLAQTPMLNQGKLLAAARFVLVGIVGDGTLQVREVREIMDRLGAAMPSGVKVGIGVVVDERWGNRVSVAVFSSDQWLQEKVVAERPSGMSELKFDPEVEPMRLAPATDPNKRKTGRPAQASLSFDNVGARGRFEDTEPTVMDGEDLDIPTFIRRGITIER
jgi:cell division protein FtsZ